MSETRKHPDLFTADEAAAYLHLENVATLDTFVTQGWLMRHKAGRQTIYWRRDLDDCALKLVGEAVAPRPKLKPLQIAQ